jgi:hypothetical protein
MPIKKIVIPLIIITSIFLSCLGVYLIIPRPIKWAITSPLDVPLCTARVADKLGIQPDFTAVKRYIIQSLRPGMTPEEVEETLNKIGPIEVAQTFVDEEHETNTEMHIRLCDNHLGNVVLLLSYSEDGYLIEAMDAYED